VLHDPREIADAFLRHAAECEQMAKFTRDPESVGKKRPRLAGEQLQVPAHASDGLDVNGLNCCARARSDASVSTMSSHWVRGTYAGF
jgi:hypothetical protein